MQQLYFPSCYSKRH